MTPWTVAMDINKCTLTLFGVTRQVTVTAPADQIQLLTLLHERNPLGCTGNPRPGCDSHPVTEASPAIMSPVSGCSCAYQSLICSSSLPTARWLWVDVMVLISSA